MNTQKENVALGIVGAFLFSLSGAVVWYICWQAGIVASLSGFVGVFCAIKGYALFAKKETIRGVVLSTVIAVVVIICAWYFSLVMDVYSELGDWIDFGDAFELLGDLLKHDEELRMSCLRDLGLGLLFCAIGCVPSVQNALKRAKAANAPSFAAEVPPVQETPEASAQAARFCPNCGTKAEQGEAFCSSCGTKL